MILSKVTIVNKLGLHARASSKFVQLAKRFASSIKLGPTENELVNAKSIMHIMTLAASKGTVLLLKIEGEDEEAAFHALRMLIENRFDEGE
ncbi:MAG: HPr family phosphocarrier protein [Gammaproteobacteria bacterium]|nr:HPr family phosphocarrier protein [Gammaproteobacteria bacterium]